MVKKTPKMELLEYRDRKQRDIRDLMGAAFVEGGTASAISAGLGIPRGTVDYWVALLDGRFEGRGINKRLVFDGYKTFGREQEAAT